MFHLRWLLVATVAHVSSERIHVQIFVEAGCPYCNKYLAGPLAKALADHDIASQIDVDISPFGNAFYQTAHCQLSASNLTSTVLAQYDVGLRNCFNKKCGAGVEQRSEDCFSGKLICQHGPKECAYDRYSACAKQVAPKTPLVSYIPFITCMKDAYNKQQSTGIEPESAALSSCATSSGLSVDELRSCYDGQAGQDAIEKEAMATPVHPGVPYILINGKPVTKESYEPDALIEAVRAVANTQGQGSFLAVTAPH